MSQTKPRSLTGIQPSGIVHIGNYLGMFKQAIAQQEKYECIYFIADMHALTSTRDPEVIRSWSYDLAATWLALGLDPENHYLFRQSDIGGEVAEFAWYLSCVTGKGLLEKAHAYKDAVAKGKEVNHGIFAYPVLMSADILIYDSDIVPVGKDQKQHVEFARDMAGSFNAIYGDGIIKLPEPYIKEEVMVIPGLDGRKMSKSYGNVVPLWSPEKALRKTLMSITSDSTPMEDPKSLEGTIIGDYYKFFGTKEAYADLESRMQAGGLGWGHAKQELFEVINEVLKEPRTRYDELRADEARLEKVLVAGAEKVKTIAHPVLNRVREAVGFSPIG